VDDGNREIAEYNGATEISHYIYGADSTPILREVFNGASTVQGSYWVHTDALGSLVAITNLNGSHTSTYNYSAFGEPSAVANAIPYQYAGMRLDPETMLYYDHARYYSPKQGRFISPDPISVKGGVNIYAYAGNDPVNNVDLSGDWYVPGRSPGSSAGAGSQTVDGTLGSDDGGGGFYVTQYTLIGSQTGNNYGSFISYDGGAGADAAAANGGVVGTIPSGGNWGSTGATVQPSLLGTNTAQPSLLGLGGPEGAPIVQASLGSLFAKIFATEAAGGGPEDPVADVIVAGEIAEEAGLFESAASTTRSLTPADIGVNEGALTQLSGSVTSQASNVTVNIGMIQGTISNPFGLIGSLISMAQAQGAATFSAIPSF